MATSGWRRAAACAVLVGVLALVGGCGGSEGDEGAAAAGTATTAPGASPETTGTALADTRFEGLPEDALPDHVDPAFLDGLQQCFRADVVGDETFRFEGPLDETTVLTEGLRAGFVDLRDCLRGVDADVSCLDALDPLAPDLDDEAYLDALVRFSECAQAQLNG